MLCQKCPRRGDKSDSFFSPRWILVVSLFWGYLAWMGISGPVWANLPFVQAPHLQVALVSEASSVTPGTTFWVGIYQRIEKDWHTYWRNPGDSGLPPSMTWQQIPGVHISRLYWPLPRMIRVKHLANYGYEREVLLLAQATVPANWKASSVRLSGKFSWLVCKEECIPGEAFLTLDIPVRPGKVVYEGPRTELFRRFRRTLPHRIHTMRMQARSDGRDFHLNISSLQPSFQRLNIEGFFPITEAILDHAAKSRIQKQKDGLHIVVKQSDDFSPGQRDRLEGLLITTETIGTDLERTGWWLSSAISASATSRPTSVPSVATSQFVSFPPQTQPSTNVKGTPTQTQHSSSVGGTRLGVSTIPATTLPLQQILAAWRPWQQENLSARGDWWSILQALFFALIGGLILNLMPCVFPVLSIKILHFVEQAQAQPREVRNHGLAFGAGVLTSFSLLALLIVLLRTSGERIGWGFQLQVPHIVLLLALVLFVMGLSLSGVFTLGDSFMNVGDSLASRSGRTGSFFTGVLATVVATPCTAPLMGAAIAFALVQPMWVSLLVFNALGVGMALPYVLLSFFPSAMRWLPRPGLWMERIKQLMAFPMYGAAVWLLWVLGKQAGRDGMTIALVAFLGVAVACWIWGTTQRRSAVWSVLAVFLGGASVGWGVYQIRTEAALVAAAQTPSTVKLATTMQIQTYGPGEKQAYSRSLLAWHLQRKDNVLLNLTADWCISCKVNEKVALQTTSVLQWMRKHRIHYLVGDWTHRELEITRVLEFFGRNGVPLYVLFHGKTQRYLFLPQILTPGLVTDSLAKFATKPGL